ncbi:MAG TPA: peptidoglycan DD-metalloendopeptidase family protein [Solirubrobacteraceae bacterium]|nr:peptidoglycan DD-metalloendopeptidase family protein [Solirubrobacteraceae bacterium]
MKRAPRPYTRAAVAVLTALAVILALGALGSRSTPARAASIGQLQNQISAGQGQISGLTGQLKAANGRVGFLQGSVSQLEAQISVIQSRLDADKARLLQLQSELEAARTRLLQLEAAAAYDESVLQRQLVSTYESDKPDLVTVVLDSTGFQDLLDRISFQQRISKQDTHVVRAVRAAKAAVTEQAIRLGALEVRQQNLTQRVLNERTALDERKIAVVNEEIAAIHVRDAKAGQLAGVRGRVASLRSQLSNLLAIQRQEAAARAAQLAAQNSPAASSDNTPGGAPAPAPVASSGGFVFPLPRGSAVGPGSWSPDDGVDISAPGDTPEYAVCSGTIVGHGIGGFGPWAPILHCDSPVGGYSYVYYGHAGPLYQLAIGTHVSAGSVISSIGPGIVGISTGPHLEIGFCDASGNPIGPGSAGTMMSLLQGSY